MTVFVLEVKGELDNCTFAAAPNNEYKISVKNPLNDYEKKEGVTIQLSELVELENAHVSDCHLAVKFEGANKFATLTILPSTSTLLKPKKKNSPSFVPTAVTETETWTSILAVECRGLEPCDYMSGDDEFVVTSEGGSTFNEEIDFSDEWCEYCEKGDAPVGVSNFQYRWTSI